MKPRGLDSLLESVSPKQVLEFYSFVEANVTRRKKEEEILQNSGKADKEGRKDIFHYLFNTKDDMGNPAYSTDELHAEANLLIIAGSDTTSTTMVGFWFVIFHSNSQSFKEPETKNMFFVGFDSLLNGVLYPADF